MNSVAAEDSQVSAVILDLDGTLLNTEQLTKEVLKDLLARYGKVVDEEKARMILGMSIEHSRHAIIKDYDLPITAEKFIQEIRPMYQQKWLLAQPLPGADRLIKHLHRHKVPFALASNSRTVSVESKISNQPGWKNYFLILLGSDQVKSGKPAPDIFLEAAKRMSVDATRCLVVEDSLIGVQAAKAARMKVVAIPSLQIEYDQFSVADMVLHSLLELRPELWGLPSFEDWVNDALPIEPIYMKGLYRNGLLHELTGEGLSVLPDQVAGIYFGWAKIESPVIFKILIRISWNVVDGGSIKKIIHVSTVEGNEQVHDQRMLISLVGFIRGLSSKGNMLDGKEMVEEDKITARTALDSLAFTNHSCIPLFSQVAFTD
ncbi:bifunctional riboflavin kinase/FMN phosphatase-like isoform X2 [Apium graveolens]|uniref:bifunctional riboflavin kinase/FMN phosphatase-like isoform X2 n=1 Tax=Apium graveolens TaxID=4045 RepID=UPI003D7B8FBA